MEKLKEFHDQFNTEIQKLMENHRNNPNLDIGAIITVYIQAACGLCFEHLGPKKGSKYLIEMVKEIAVYATKNP